MPYNHHEIEKKWQDRWERSGVFHALNDSDKPKFYCLIEFPYPSGAGLHIGHPRSYTALDVVARKRRMEGFNVMYPIGWDAFGLPTENYAIKTGRPPQEVTAENIATFKRQLQALGLSFDWSREVNTTDPEYYKWTQWMFLEFFKAGLAYKASMPINWCVSCKIGLANEEVVDGKCERCGGPTEKRDKAQWMIAITKYAERLLSDLDTVDYVEKIKTQQRNWIGKSEGALVRFVIANPAKPGEAISAEIASAWRPPRNDIEVFTTRPDTLFGATFLVISPEVAKKWVDVGWDAPPEVRAYVESALKRSDIERGAEDREKTGVATGVMAVNPADEELIPVWVADYVLGGYGTGAIMAVPAHDERDLAFAEKFGLPVRKVVDDEEEEAKEKMIAWLEEKKAGERKVTYKLRDWVFSRQRYWGEPIPLVWCEKCSSVIASPAKPDEAISAEIASSSPSLRADRPGGPEVAPPRNDGGSWIPVPDDQLPVRLPEVKKYEPTDTGESPLAAMEEWVNTSCPQCGGAAKRETDTMPNWAGSSWYFLAYAMHAHLSAQPASQLPTSNRQLLNYWMPVDWYNGGMEHTVLHLLYSRFWNKFLFDRGHVPTSEPYAKRTSHGLILAEDGTKMSKSKGKVVNPDEMVAQYGADAVRLYELFMGPFAEPVPWSVNGLVGMRRFLEKVTDLIPSLRGSEATEAISAEIASSSRQSGTPRNDVSITRLLHQTIKKVSDDIEQMRFNTAVSAMMIFVNAVKEQGSISKESFTTFLRLLCPFAPHIANELYEQIGGIELLETLAWPIHDPGLMREDVVNIGIQVNGKLRATMAISPTADVVAAFEMAKQNANVKKYLEAAGEHTTFYVPGKILNILIK